MGQEMLQINAIGEQKTNHAGALRLLAIWFVFFFFFGFKLKGNLGFFTFTLKKKESRPSFPLSSLRVRKTK